MTEQTAHRPSSVPPRALRREPSRIPDEGAGSSYLVLPADRRCTDAPCLDHPSIDRDAVIREVLSAHPEESFCFLNESRLRERARMLLEHFLPGDPNRRIVYAVKANPLRRIVKTLRDEGLDGFDCASPREIDLVRGVAPSAEILFSHPIKTGAAIRHAVAHHVSYFAAQSPSEVRKILANCQKAGSAVVPDISIRMRTPNASAAVDLSAKFGASLSETKDMLRLLREETSARRGISIHVGSQNMRVESFESAIHSVAELASDVDSINLGGGIPVNYHPDQEFDFVAYLERITSATRTMLAGARRDGGDPTVIIELGRAIVAEAVDLVIPIVSVEHRDGRPCLYINDGVFTSFSDAPINKWDYHFEAIGQDLRPLSGGERENYVVFGRTCDSGDVLHDVVAPKNLREGDFLWLRNAGAYMDSQASYFNGFSPPPYVVYNR